MRSIAAVSEMEVSEKYSGSLNRLEQPQHSPPPEPYLCPSGLKAPAPPLHAPPHPHPGSGQEALVPPPCPPYVPPSYLTNFPPKTHLNPKPHLTPYAYLPLLPPKPHFTHLCQCSM